MSKKFLWLAALAASAVSNAQFISEIHINAPGTDQGQEFLELQATPGFMWAGYYLLGIEGDGANAGTCDIVQNLGSYISGSNGLVLVRDDATVVLQPAPAPETSTYFFDWNPDIENGTQTFVLGFGTPPAQSADLDTDNDGVIDAGALAGFTVVDAVSVLEDDVANANTPYAAQLGGVEFGVTPDTDGGTYTGDALVRILNSAGTAPNGWVLLDVLGAAPGPYPSDPTEFTYLGPASPAPTADDLLELTPGNLNLKWGGASATISGTVTLNNSDADWSNETVTIEIVDPNNSSTVQTISGVALGVNGAYSAATTAPAGTYDVYIKGDTFLRKLTGGVVFNASGATVNATLINGDVDGDNEIAPNDFSILSGAFGNVDGDPGYSAAADLDDDGEVGPSDFSILAANFGQSGD